MKGDVNESGVGKKGRLRGLGEQKYTIDLKWLRL